jgi:hypothetical protein
MACGRDENTSSGTGVHFVQPALNHMQNQNKISVTLFKAAQPLE